MNFRLPYYQKYMVKISAVTKMKVVALNGNIRQREIAKLLRISSNSMQTTQKTKLVGISLNNPKVTARQVKIISSLNSAFLVVAT